MKFSILHISDLHQNLKDEILPDVLLDTIANDFLRFATEDPAIRFPDLCVVSGDIVYGHRHRTDCFDQKYRLGDTPRTMTVIAAGTLCAGPANLSPGIPRGYSIVEIDTDAAGGRVHSRQMVNQLQSIPIWAAGRFLDASGSFLDFDLSPPIQKIPESLDVELILERASDLLGQHRWKDVIDELSPIAQHPTARRLFVEALQHIDDSALIIECLSEPENATEAVIFGAALMQSGNALEVERFLSFEMVVNSSDASLKDVKARLKRRFGK